MNRIRWVAWGVIDIEKLERMQRRNYIKAVRVEIAEIGATLECGGSTKQPYYQFILAPTPEGHVEKHAAAGKDGFKKACQWLLQILGDGQGEGHERSTDGGVRGAGDEAEGHVVRVRV